MLYEINKIVATASYQHWLTDELYSSQWFLTMTVIALFYTVWLKLVDKSRLSHLLLLGSLSAIGFVIAEVILIGLLGVAEYKIRPFALMPPLFIVSITKAPILYMLVQQYTNSWKSYTLWAGIGTAGIAFGLFPLYSLVGIYQLHHWNYLYQFLLMFTDGMIARALLLWVINIEQKQMALHPVSPTFSRLQPVATKPLNEDTDDITDNDQQ